LCSRQISILFGKLVSGGIARIDLENGAITIHREPAKAGDAAN
jgi:hypothetical protein